MGNSRSSIRAINYLNTDLNFVPMEDWALLVFLWMFIYYPGVNTVCAHANTRGAIKPAACDVVSRMKP